MKQKNSTQFQPSRVARKIDVTDLRAAYDENVKWLLSEKIFLAHIMVYAVKEYKGMNPWDVCELIEGEPQVGKVAVNPGETNTAEIVGDNVENTVPNEGKITYDIRFHAWAPGKDKLIELLIDIEAQRKYHPGYDLVTRGIFYGARMISAQMGTEFQDDNYDDLKKVYSIWICMDSPRYAENTITEYSIQQSNIIGDFPNDKTRYDLMSVLMICLPSDLALGDDNTKLHRLLGALLSSTLTRQQKKDIMELEYGIPMTQEIERSVSLMCNLSETIEEKAIEQGFEKGVEKGIKKGIEKGIEQGIERGEAIRLVKSIEANMRNFHIDLETACKGNDVTVEDYWKAKKCIGEE